MNSLLSLSNANDKINNFGTSYNAFRATFFNRSNYTTTI